MPRVSRVAMAVLLVIGATPIRPSTRLMAASDGNGVTAKRPVQGATLKPVASPSPNIPFSDYDPQAEQLLWNLANQARAKAGLRSLMLDEGLSQAARAHAQAMAAAHQLSHQFDGELPLARRLADMTSTLLDQEGENVAFDYDAESGHKHLMLSPPHRANLLKASYNVVGLGVIRSGERLYIVQDFGHALPNYSAAEVKERIAATVVQMRHHAKQRELARRDLPAVDDAACSMAQADKLAVSAIHQLSQRYSVFTYTSLYPETLPATAEHTLAGRNLHGFSVGACYARTQTYPTGVYWVVLALE